MYSRCIKENLDIVSALAETCFSENSKKNQIYLISLNKTWGILGNLESQISPNIAPLNLTCEFGCRTGQNPPFPPNGRNSLSLHRGSVAARNLRTVMRAPGLFELKHSLRPQDHEMDFVYKQYEKHRSRKKLNNT